MIPNVRFYDEREWRFVPQLPEGDPYRWGMAKRSFLDDVELRAANNRIENELTLLRCDRPGIEPPTVPKA
jgi:hypothetical protein